jgi:hypothetical protein
MVFGTLRNNRSVRAGLFLADEVNSPEKRRREKLRSTGGNDAFGLLDDDDNDEMDHGHNDSYHFQNEQLSPHRQKQNSAALNDMLMNQSMQSVTSMSAESYSVNVTQLKQLQDFGSLLVIIKLRRTPCPIP